MDRENDKNDAAAAAWVPTIALHENAIGKKAAVSWFLLSPRAQSSSILWRVFLTW
jgi:hypothetical protein